MRACEERLQGITRAIHVMDREGDNYDLLSELEAAQSGYVIRLSYDRRLVGERDKLREVVGRAPSLFRREVHVSTRAVGLPRDPHAAREAREATLEVSAMAVTLSRSSNFAPGSPPSLNVNVVTVVERDCPEGQEPIAWYLVTSEPIDTAEQVAEVVDAYRARWVIEEFFKALEDRVPRSRRGRWRATRRFASRCALFLPIAVRLLALRDAARTEPEQACSALTARQLQRKPSSVGV